MSATYLVVLTATVIPLENIQLKRCDPKLRLEDYKAGLRFWLRHPHPKLNKILFLENSGADLSELRTLCTQENPFHKDVEFISMNTNRIPEGVDYGYAEMEMLDLGLQQSRLRPQTTHMIKATGRLTFPAIGKLLNRLPERFDVCVECRIQRFSYHWKSNPFKVLSNRKGAYTTCQLMIFAHEFYRRELQSSYLSLVTVQGSKKVEFLLLSRLLSFEGEPGVYLRWPVNVEPVGVTGHSNIQYRSLKRSATSLLRGVLRRVHANWWL